MHSHNKALLASLRDSEHGETLLEQAKAEVKNHRLMNVEPLDSDGEAPYLLSPRFGLVQHKTDGSTKIRAIDNFSWSTARGTKRAKKLQSINGAMDVQSGIKHDCLDKLVACIRICKEVLGINPGLIKADIDSAFRRVPLHPDDRWAAGVVFRVGEKLFTAQHAACPFGAARGNVIWDTVGKILASLIRRFLKIGVLRYVDDLFAPEHPSTMEHASRCITRFVRLLLGPDAIADKKV